MVESKDRLRAGISKRIYVNRKLVNTPDGRPLSIQTFNSRVITARRIHVDGPVDIIFDPDKSSNPRAWIQTMAAVEVVE